MVLLHIMKRGFRPWSDLGDDGQLDFMVAHAPLGTTLRQLMETLFKGDKIADEDPRIIQCFNDGRTWRRGPTWLYHAEHSKQSLADIGWTAESPANRSPVWLAWGLGDPDPA